MAPPSGSKALIFPTWVSSKPTIYDDLEFIIGALFVKYETPPILLLDPSESVILMRTWFLDKLWPLVGLVTSKNASCIQSKWTSSLAVTVIQDWVSSDAKEISLLDNLKSSARAPLPGLSLSEKESDSVVGLNVLSADLQKHKFFVCPSFNSRSWTFIGKAEFLDTEKDPWIISTVFLS